MQEPGNSGSVGARDLGPVVIVMSTKRSGKVHEQTLVYLIRIHTGIHNSSRNGHGSPRLIPVRGTINMDDSLRYPGR